MKFVPLNIFICFFWIHCHSSFQETSRIQTASWSTYNGNKVFILFLIINVMWPVLSGYYHRNLLAIIDWNLELLAKITPLLYLLIFVHIVSQKLKMKLRHFLSQSFYSISKQHHQLRSMYLNTGAGWVNSHASHSTMGSS